MSELVRSPSGTSRATSWWSTAGFYFHINLNILFMFYAQFCMTNQYKLVLRMPESTMSPSGTQRATSWWCTAGFYFHINLHILFMFYAQFCMTNQYKLVLRMCESTRPLSGTSRTLVSLFILYFILFKQIMLDLK